MPKKWCVRLVEKGSFNDNRRVIHRAIAVEDRKKIPEMVDIMTQLFAHELMEGERQIEIAYGVNRKKVGTLAELFG